MFGEVVCQLPEKIIREFKKALLRGHWENGLKLTDEQKRICKKALKFRNIEYESVTTRICH